MKVVIDGKVYVPEAEVSAPGEAAGEPAPLFQVGDWVSVREQVKPIHQKAGAVGCVMSVDEKRVGVNFLDWFPAGHRLTWKEEDGVARHGHGYFYCFAPDSLPHENVRNLRKLTP